MKIVKRVHVFVKGYVQGVFFRKYTEKLASKHNIKGWVRNRKNGDVEIVGEGEDKSIQKFLMDLWNGPGKVEDVCEKYEDSFENSPDFKRLETV